MSEQPSIVLVHGAWADGSCWSSVIESLQAEGYEVTAPQFPETSLADDVARLRHVLSRQSGPTVVVGHSYGGQIMTSLGQDAPNAIALVYIAAFGLDEGESLGALLGAGPPTPSLANLIVDELGFAYIPQGDFVEHFACGVDPVKAKVPARRPAADLDERVRRRHGRAGVEGAPVVVPGRRERRGHPAGCRAPVRRTHGGDHRRGGLRSPRHGLPCR